MLSVRVDTFPVVVTTFGEGFESSDFAVFRTAHEEIFAREKPYVSVLDTSTLVTIPSLALREEVLEFVRLYADRAMQRCLSTEVVVRSVAVRAAFSTVQWFASTPATVSLHASLRPAIARAMDVVWTHELSPSPELLAYHDAIMIQASMPPPPRASGSFGKQAFESSIEGLLRRVRRDGRNGSEG